MAKAESDAERAGATRGGGGKTRGRGGIVGEEAAVAGSAAPDASVAFAGSVGDCGLVAGGEGGGLKVGGRTAPADRFSIGEGCIGCAFTSAWFSAAGFAVAFPPDVASESGGKGMRTVSFLGSLESLMGLTDGEKIF